MATNDAPRFHVGDWVRWIRRIAYSDGLHVVYGEVKEIRGATLAVWDGQEMSYPYGDMVELVARPAEEDVSER